MNVIADSTVDSGHSEDSFREDSDFSIVSLESPSSVELANLPESEWDVGSEKRQKLNLWKCKQCRDARKKCCPADRIWPQKCDRCLSHRPEPLDQSELELNTQKREPNLKDVTKGKRPHLEDQSTSERQEPQNQGGYDSSSSDDGSIWKRPIRTPVGIARSHPGIPANTPIITITEDYRPASCYLPLGEGEFRVLKLDPGKQNAETVSCSFVTASMNQPMKYEAISYLWGGLAQESKKIILVDPDGNHYSVFIRSQLYQALRFLRHPQKHRHFWIDALCINYGIVDRVEKNQQTAMKRYIFRNATNLCFWLGEDESCRTALKFIPRILDFGNMDRIIRDHTEINNWVAFLALLKNPIFSRSWIVQEVAIAPNVTLHCGQTAIHWGDFVDSVTIFASSRDDISLLFRRNWKNYKDVLDRRITTAERFVNISANAFRPTNSGTIDRQLSLESLVCYLSEFVCTNPLDRIYSVLSMAKDGPKLDERTLNPHYSESRYQTALRIDYDANVSDVYQRFVLHTIKNSNSLDIICRNWAKSVSKTKWILPTWVSPLQSSLQITAEISERVTADNLVGAPGHSYYNACGAFVFPTFYVQDIIHLHKAKSLFVRGFIVDTIVELGPRAEDGIILQEWLELGHYDSSSGTVPEDFWRTIVADRGPNGSEAPSWYSRAFLYCLRLSPTGNINTNKLIAQSEAEQSLVIEFLQRVQSVIWNRKFLVSETKSYLGLAPMAAQVGDIICILCGCTVPVVLRRQKDIDGIVYFQLVGECYVHRIMDGEAVAAGYTEVEFELR
ncbi:hypothetical protein N431DRAFT_398153 [Stipitochalara longipes BDJ]|nr:hypothetical protein N431DRAFT_398153 [Stipitochalara longipes BDJ]